MNHSQFSDAGIGEVNFSLHLNKILNTSSALQESDGLLADSEANVDLVNIANSLLDSGPNNSNNTNSLVSGGMHTVIPKKGHRRESSGIALQRSTPQNPAL